MAFARKVWKLLVALKDGLVLLFMLLFFALLYAALSMRPGPAAVRDGALLIELNGLIVEEPSSPSPIAMLISQEAPLGEYRARDLTRALRAAAKDDRIKSVVLDLSGFIGGGFVHMREIGEALDAVRASGKKVYTFGLAYVDSGALLAAHSDEVWVDPNGGAFITGPGSNRLYYAGLLERLKVNVNVFRVGTFKSAVEPYLLSGPSDASRAADAALYGAIWKDWQADYRRARPKVDLTRITSDPVAWLKASGGDAAEAAKTAGLVDRIGTKSEFNRRIAQVAGTDSSDSGPGFAHTSLPAWLSAVPEKKPGKAIGVVTIAGEIVNGDAGPGVAGADRIVGVLEDALEEDLAALVVRVDSPGGSIMGSEQIRRAILRFQEKKIPIVVSMSNLAASGGYWVSTPASRIFAAPETITGSIGVFAVVPTFGEALASWGVNTGGFKTTPLSGEPNVVSGLTPEVSAMLQTTVEHNYDRFVGLVSASRKITPQSAPDWAEGRPWPGETARQLGLVDQLGGLDDALAYAAKTAGLKDGDWHAEFLGQQAADPVSMVLASLTGGDQGNGRVHGDFAAALTANQDRVVGQIAATVRSLFEVRGVQAYCMECPPAYSAAASKHERSDASFWLGKWLGFTGK